MQDVIRLILHGGFLKLATPRSQSRLPWFLQRMMGMGQQTCFPSAAFAATLLSSNDQVSTELRKVIKYKNYLIRLRVT